MSSGTPADVPKFVEERSSAQGDAGAAPPTEADTWQEVLRYRAGADGERTHL